MRGPRRTKLIAGALAVLAVLALGSYIVFSGTLQAVLVDAALARLEDQ